MKATHHPSLFAGRAAGEVTVTKYRRGQVASVETVAAGTLATVKDFVDNKRGPKPGKKPDPNKFAETATQYWED